MNSSNSSSEFQGEGNTSSSPCKQISPAKRWCFTLNNYNDQDLESFRSIVPIFCDKCIIGKEVGESGTPHLQGYIEFKTKKRPKSVFGFNNTIHWEKARGTPLENLKYCSKDENVFFLLGLPRPVVKMTYDMLRPEQKNIVDIFKNDEDPLFGRLVYWFWEPDGNWGKSIVCKYMIDFMEAFVVQGKNNDILHGLKDFYDNKGYVPKIVIFDIPRCNENHVSYQAIESIKNGFFYSGKYEGGMVRFNSPHVLCFSNEEPNCYNLSEDRWIIRNLKET